MLEKISQYPLDQIYFYLLIGCAGLAFLLFLFGDIFQFDGAIDPMLIVPWLAFTSLVGFIGEKFTEFNSWWIFIGGAAIATLLVFFLNFYLLVPLKNSDATLSSSEKELEGRVATVVTTIPIKGMGEIALKSVTGSTNRPATFYSPQEKELHSGEKVLVIEIRERVCYVIPYENNFV